MDESVSLPSDAYSMATEHVIHRDRAELIKLVEKLAGQIKQHRHDDDDR